MRKPIIARAVALFLVVQLGGCAGNQAFRRGEDLAKKGEYDAAVAKYFEAVQANPDRQEFRMGLQNIRVKAAQEHMKSGRRLVEKRDYRAASGDFQQAAALDPSNETARQELKKAQNLLKGEELTDQAEEFYRARKFPQARNRLEEALSLNPGNSRAQELLGKVKGEKRTVLDGFELDVASDKPITLKFKDAEIRDVFNILSRLSGINFIFDEDVKAQKVTILLENATFAQALELLLRLNTLERKILNAKTILIYPQTKEKEKKFEDQIIQTFYLSNIDAKKAVNLLRTMLTLRKIYVHEELNALVIRDTPATVKLAQQVIEAADRADSEVLFELELVEVAHDSDLDFGIAGPYSTPIGLAAEGATAIPDSIVREVGQGLGNLDVLYTIPSTTFTAKKLTSDSEILANPRVRVKNKEKAKVHIGSREPIVTNTLTSTGDVTSTNVQYVDVGVKLDVEPTVQLDNSVVTKLSLEVSSVTKEIPIGEEGKGGSALRISTTNASSVLVLRDGEQTIIGGLIGDEVSKTKTRIPLLGDIPLIGNLLSSNKKKKNKREILLSITPHIVRNIDMPRSEVATIWSGGEEDLDTGALFGAFAVPLEAEASQLPPAAAPAMQPVAPATAKPIPLELKPAEPIPAPQPLPVGSEPGLPAPTPAPVLPAPAAVAPVAPAIPVPSASAPSPAPEAAPGPEAIPPAPAPESAPAAVGEAAVTQLQPVIQPQPSTQPQSSPVPVASVPVPVPEPPAAALSAAPAAAAPSTPMVTAPTEPAPVPSSVPTLPAPTAPAPARIVLQAPAEVKAGEEFTLTVQVDQVRNLYSAPLFVMYDPLLLQFVRAEEGDFLKAAGQSTIFTSSTDERTGRLIIGYKQGVGGTGANGTGTLFRLTFRGVAPGPARLAADRINFRDPTGNRLPVTGAEAALVIK